ncbi:VOC family protein [Streptacidiphilus sp. BW17]|uniref:VOC family protein n=1 Tax=Streptacidiphilus sp. BW17 TaxID=3156274 RepID=UPI0035145C55
MANNFKTIIYPVRHVEKAKALFAALLGEPPAHENTYYVGWSIESQDIGLNSHGFEQGMTGPVPYVDVADIQARVRCARGGRASVLQEPTDVGGGSQIATARDADGNVIGLRGTAA